METREEIEEELTSHFKEIMTEDNTDRGQDIDKIIPLIPKTVSREDNESLIKPISMYEVEDVMNMMAQGKSPSPDDFTFNFFHLFWDMIKEEVWAIVEELQKSRGVLKSFNAVFLSLIPKGEGADTPGNFRPIPLCNVI